MSANMNSWSRREFLKIAGTTGLGIMGGTSLHKTGLAATDQESGDMPVRPFGRTGVSVPILGFDSIEHADRRWEVVSKLVAANKWEINSAVSTLAGPENCLEGIDP